MPKIEQDLSQAEVYGPIPEGMYILRADNAVLKHSNAVKDLTDFDEQKTPHNMVDIELVVDEGEFKDKKATPYPHHLMIGGRTKDGKPMPLGMMCEFLDCFKIRWTCKGCGVSAVGFDKTDKRHYKCTKCHKTAGISWNTDDIQAKRAKAQVGTEPIEGSEDRRNRIIRFYPLETPSRGV